jgi:hypothetical protein
VDKKFYYSLNNTPLSHNSPITGAKALMEIYTSHTEFNYGRIYELKGGGSMLCWTHNIIKLHSTARAPHCCGGGGGESMRVDSKNASAFNLCAPANYRCDRCFCYTFIKWKNARCFKYPTQKRYHLF